MAYQIKKYKLHNRGECVGTVNFGFYSNPWLFETREEAEKLADTLQGVGFIYKVVEFLGPYEDVRCVFWFDS